MNIQLSILLILISGMLSFSLGVYIGIIAHASTIETVYDVTLEDEEHIDELLDSIEDEANGL